MQFIGALLRLINIGVSHSCDTESGDISPEPPRIIVRVASFLSPNKNGVPNCCKQFDTPRDSIPLCPSKH